MAETRFAATFAEIHPTKLLKFKIIQNMFNLYIRLDDMYIVSGFEKISRFSSLVVRGLKTPTITGTWEVLLRCVIIVF